MYREYLIVALAPFCSHLRKYKGGTSFPPSLVSRGTFFGDAHQSLASQTCVRGLGM